MTFRLALRSLAARPVRSAVLSCGFGLGIAVAASLLGIGEVILEQARAPELTGGGDLMVSGSAGRVDNVRFLTASVLTAPPFAGRVAVASPSSRTTLYLVRPGGTEKVYARAGIPSLERGLGDPETSLVAAWQDTRADRAWVAPDPGELLRGMDRFHEIPAVPARADSWAEWLYFNGQAGTTRFYLTFMTGPRTEHGRRAAWVRLQLAREGRVVNYSEAAEVDEHDLLERAPDLSIGNSSVRLEGTRYRVTIDLPAEDEAGSATRGSENIRGEIVLQATPGRSVPPLSVRGLEGWVSGYVVPVLSGPLAGILWHGEERIVLDGGTGYHDHNWGFWKGVSWQWGQVAGEGLSFVYGRIFPPRDAADPERMPGFMTVVGPEGPIAYSLDVRIDELDDDEGRPSRIKVRSRGATLDLEMQLTVDDLTISRIRNATSPGRELDFMQMRATYRVTGRLDGRAIEFSALGSAETFRGR